jgi:hypothetical protein
VVTVTGTSFTGATAVKFGTKAATTFTVLSDTKISVTSPSHSIGTVDVTVTGPGGTSSITLADQFSYVAAPRIRQVTPSSGAAAGGTVVTISGRGFLTVTSVTFGSKPAASFTIVSDSEITATAPAGAAGSVDTTVTNPGGSSDITSAGRFTYV